MEASLSASHQRSWLAREATVVDVADGGERVWCKKSWVGLGVVFCSQ